MPIFIAMVAAPGKLKTHKSLEKQAKYAFRSKPERRHHAQGFVRNKPAEIHFFTAWEREEDSGYWHCPHLQESHQNIPKGIKLLPQSWELAKYEHIGT